MPSCVIRQPNFFIVGAAKAGTTSLYNYLDQHPDIYMSPLKEPAYFSKEVRPDNFEPSHQAQVRKEVEDVRKYVHGPMSEKRNGGIVIEWSDYVRLFAGATTQRAIGEASVSYLWSPTAAAEIAARTPDARIIIVLRAPAERAFSQYLKAVSDGILSEPFRSYVRASLRHKGEGLGIHKPFLEMGFYADQVQRYLDHFPREQIGIWLYEEGKMHPRRFMREVLEFLEVDSAFIPDASKRHHEPQIARLVKSSQVLRRVGMWQILKRLTPTPIKSFVRDAVYRPTGSLTLEPEDKAMMLGFYRSDIHRLEGILNRDLSAWLV